MMRARIALLLLALCASAALAHKPSDSYLVVAVAGDKVRGQWDIALRDLDFAIGLDSNGNGEITWGELRARHAEIDAYALARLTIALDGATCRAARDRTSGRQSQRRRLCGVALRGDLPASAGAVLTLGYSLFADLDPQHKGLLRLEYDGVTRTRDLRPGRRAAALRAEKA